MVQVKERTPVLHLMTRRGHAATHGAVGWWKRLWPRCLPSSWEQRHQGLNGSERELS